MKTRLPLLKGSRLRIALHLSCPEARTALLLLLLLGASVRPAAAGVATNATNPAQSRPKASPGPVMQARPDRASGQIDITENGKPVLRYNFQTVEPGEVLTNATPANRIYARPRSDYIHPLYGLNGEVLTRDWPVDHPHHRGIYWAWPEVDYGSNRGDLHALQKVFARPVGKARCRSGPDFADVVAENLWQWEDREPIVREQATIRAYRATAESRVIDLTLRFTALKDGITLARRETAHYGGLSIRMATPASQNIAVHTDPANAFPRRAWSDLSGIFAGASTPSGLTVLQSQGNPDYPGDYYQQPALSWCQPTFPAAGTRYALHRNEPLVLCYRLVVHAGGTPDDDQAAKLWNAFNGLEGTSLPASELESLLAYHAAREILVHINGVTNVPEARTMWVFKNWPDVNSLVWSPHFFLRNIPGIAGVTAGFSNAPPIYAATLISPRHYVTTDHVLWFEFYQGHMLARFVGTNNVDYWARSLQSTNLFPVYQLHFGIGILDHDMPPQVGFAAVLPTNAPLYFGTSNLYRLQGFAYSQDSICWLTSFSRRFGEEIGVDGRQAFAGVGVERDPGGWTGNVHIRAGDSGGPLRTIVNGRVVLLGVASGFPDFSKNHDLINATMHYLSTNNGLSSDYQLTPADLSRFKTQP